MQRVDMLSLQLHILTPPVAGGGEGLSCHNRETYPALRDEQVYLNEWENLADLSTEKEQPMREIQSSEVKAHLPQYLSAVERGETIVITRRGRPVAHLVPAPEQNRERVRKALDAIADLRRTVASLSVDEILAARHEGHGY